MIGDAGANDRASPCLSTRSRRLLYVLAAANLALGAVLLVAPDWAAGEFSWKVSPFVVGTIGGWCLGNAAYAWLAGRDGRPAVVGPLLAYLLIFGLSELAVLGVFRVALDLGVVLAWPYIATLVLTVIAAGIASIEVVRTRAIRAPVGESCGPWVRLVIVLFILFVGFLAIGGTAAREGGLSTTGGIFPEPLTLFTVRAFAAFYFSLAAAAAVVVLAFGRMPAVIAYSIAGQALIAPITIVALVNLPAFDFVERPGGVLYLGAYLGAAVLSAWLLGTRWLSARRRDAAASA